MKTKLFMWLALNNKVLTWKMLQKRNKEGPSIFLLCRQGTETTTHLFVDCIYA